MDKTTLFQTGILITEAQSCQETIELLEADGTYLEITIWPSVKSAGFTKRSMILHTSEVDNAAILEILKMRMRDRRDEAFSYVKTNIEGMSEELSEGLSAIKDS